LNVRNEKWEKIRNGLRHWNWKDNRNRLRLWIQANDVVRNHPRSDKFPHNWANALHQSCFDPTDKKELRRRSAAISRKLALLCAHGLLQKVQKGHHFRLTRKGAQSLTALLAAANSYLTQLTQLDA
jgi:hypothetical protein